jgi:hypothetical protein
MLRSLVLFWSLDKKSNAMVFGLKVMAIPEARRVIICTLNVLNTHFSVYNDVKVI